MTKPPKDTSANSPAARKTKSWIESFTEWTDNTDSPALFRKWSAIFTIAATLEMKCWLKTSAKLYPNMYIFLVGNPGVGKNRIIRKAKQMMNEVHEFHFAPTSVTAASLVDTLAASKRFIARLPDDPIEYHNTTITSEELSAFMNDYDKAMVGLLTALYDDDPYNEERRGRPENKVKIPHPQLNLISGTTPSNLITMMPEFAWDQGFTSRILLVFSDERIIGDDFADRHRELNPDLSHDIKQISTLTGEFKVTKEYQSAVNAWRAAGERVPDFAAPNHPKLSHYKTRRRVHLYKLSMVACVDRGDVLLLTKEDFNRAMGWLVEAEAYMPDIFSAGSTGTDAKALDEIVHFVNISDRGSGLPERDIMNFARQRVPLTTILRVIEIMVASGQIANCGVDRFGQRWFKAIRRADLN